MRNIALYCLIIVSLIALSSYALAAASCKFSVCPSQEAVEGMKPRILIVGGGIGGLALANALTTKNIPFDLIEKKEAWSHEGAGIALPANAVWALQQIGFEHELKTKTQLIEAMSFKTDQDELLIKEDITKIHNAGTQFRSIHRADLHSMLLEKIDESQIRMGCVIKSLNQQQDTSEIEVEFSDHSKKIYDLVVGADGLHSEVRQHIFGDIPLAYQGIATWRSVIETPEGLDHPHYMLGEDTVFLLYPINDEKTYIYGHYIDTNRTKDVLADRLVTLNKLFGGYKGFVSEALKKIDCPQKIIPGYLDSVSEVKWSKGNVVLIGDASHACSPMLQQGGALAIEDAWVLAEELSSGFYREETVTQIIESFVKRRAERVEWIVKESDKKIKLLPEVRNNFIKQNGAPNVAMFKLIMKENP